MPPAPRTSYSAHKLKHDTVKEAYSKDTEEAAKKCLQSLQHLLNNTNSLSPQRRADKARDIVNNTIKNVAYKHIPPPQGNMPGTNSRSHHLHPTPQLRSLTKQIKTLTHKIRYLTTQNPTNPHLTLLTQQLHHLKVEMQKEKQKVHDERLQILSPQLRLTPLAETQNTAWKLLKKYQSATTTSKNNLPTHMRTNNSTDKRIWEESDEPAKTPHEGVKGASP